MTHADSSGPAARTPRQLLADRTFGPFFIGKLGSALGIWIQNISAAILVFQITGSATLVGAVSVLQFLPQVVIAPWAGVLTDRVNRKRLLMAGRGLSCSASAVLALVLLGGPSSLPGVWPVHAAALALGIGLAFSAPAMQALVPSLVPRRDLDAAIALNSSTGNIARAVGPAFGATLYATVGPAAAFGLSALGHLGYILALAAIRTGASPTFAGSSIRGAVTYLRDTPIMVALLVCVGALGFAVDPIITLTPPLAELLGGGEALVGALASAFGVGALIALGGYTRMRNRWGLARLGIGGFGVLAAGLAALALSPGPVWALVSMVIAGTGFLFSTSSLTSRIQLRVPDELRGRVMALWGVAFLGSRPLAATVNGIVADVLSPRVATMFAAALTLVAGVLAARFAPARKH